MLVCLYYFCSKDLIKCNHADYNNHKVYNHLFPSLSLPLKTLHRLHTVVLPLSHPASFTTISKVLLFMYFEYSMSKFGWEFSLKL